MKILILGITSYLSQKLLEKISNEAVEIYTLSYDEKNYERIMNLPKIKICAKKTEELNHVKFNQVWNFVTYYGLDQKKSEEINYKYPLELIKKINFEKIINCSTCLKKEESTYSFNKNKLENELANLFPDKILNLKITNFYGIDYPHNNFITSCIEALKTNENFKIQKPSYSIDLIYIDDLILILRNIFKNNLNVLNEKELYIGKNNQLELKVIAQKIKGLLGSKSLIILNDETQNFISNQYDFNKMKLYNLTAPTSLEEGIKRILNR